MKEPTAMPHCVRFALCLLASAFLVAQGPPGGGMRGMVSPVVAALDLDRDGELSALEIEVAAASLRTLDKDGDGNLSRQEMLPAMGGRGRRGGPGGPGGGGPGGGGPGGGGPGGGGPGMGGGFDPFADHPILRALDDDGDGELFEDEVTEAAAALWRLDKNGDGVLSGEEIEHRPFGRGMRPGTFGPGGAGGSRERYQGGVPAPRDLHPDDGVATIADRAAFHALSYQGDEVMIDTHLAGMEFVKFQIEDAAGASPRLYFMNTKTHRAHPMFMRTIGVDERDGTTRMRGVLVWRPTLLAPNGEAGLYTYEFEPNDAYGFELVKVAFDLLHAHGPVFAGRLSYNLLPRARTKWATETARYEHASLPVFDPNDASHGVGFLALHRAVGFGRLVVAGGDDRPGLRDVVVYRSLPNELPRVAGVITAERQTPLSHVNLRAVQDRIPNAFVARADELPMVLGLVGKLVRYEVQKDAWSLREATSAEVDAHFEALRPKTTQTPRRDLTQRTIRPLHELGFDDAASVGVKAANLAVLRTLGLGDVPDGFAVPFALYDEFMRHNGFYEMVRKTMATHEFRSDPAARQQALAQFQKTMQKGKLPKSLERAFADAQARFPAGTSIRCRSSTNNEDLPGFSGAGLYDSFTHRPDEGQLGKTIRQVYASLWNFRAFEEREFHRVDHFAVAMGVVLHPNTSGERANGVAVSKDVLHTSADARQKFFYVNVQVGDDLVTNPAAGSTPEEWLVGPRNPAGDRLVARSSRVPVEATVLSKEQLLDLRRQLRTAHRAFARLYGREADPEFAIEVEFKVDRRGALFVKQARPWVE
jgi:hypothetical protein